MANKSDCEIYSELCELPAVGEGFYEPAIECAELGRPLQVASKFMSDDESVIRVSPDEPSTFWISSLFAQITTQASNGEVVFGLYPRRLFGDLQLQAVLIGDVYQLLDLELQFVTAMSTRHFVALSREQADLGLSRPTSSR